VAVVLSSVVGAFRAILQTPRFLLNPNPAAYYDYLGDDVVEGHHGKFSDPSKPLWLNLGYWKSARVYPEAAQALAAQLADAAQLGPADALLDVGFGFAEQDLFWVERYGVRHITGINITPMQVQRAQERVRARAHDSRIDLRVGSATELPFEAASFDKVTALECAHHFDTRERFFAEAFRVLRPGGRLATADGTSCAGDPPPKLVQRMALKRWCVPLANLYDRAEYCRKLEAVGFRDVRAESIRNYVFPGCTKYHALRNRGVPMNEAVISLSQQEIDACYGLELWKLTGLTDYVLFSAQKPA
jgi:microcystin synthetase protein McyJ